MRKNKSYIYLFSIFTAISLSLLLVNYACQKKEKIYVIGYINPNPEEEEGAQGFLRNMPRFGFTEGKNVTYIKSETKDTKAIEKALNDMTAKHADLIFAMSTPAAKLALHAAEGTNIPVVFIMYNAVGTGVVKSLVRPGGNITGVQLRGSTPKSLEFLLAVVPDAKHIFVPIKFDTGAAKQSLDDLKQGSAKCGLKVTVSEVATVDDLRAAMSSMPGDVDAIFMLHSWLVGSNMNIVIDNAIKRKVPVFSAGHVDFKNGVVLSYAPLDDRSGLQAARLARAILRDGNPPSDLPVETADFFLGINLKTAEAVGLKIPNSILQQADFIIRE
ncbi:MAG: ABC transporter substrate-binding protein [Nitrospirae bacterium]|nr:ABC transporter substrate-binding protein [Nitrospirota bacterium]